MMGRSRAIFSTKWTIDLVSTDYYDRLAPREADVRVWSIAFYGFLLFVGACFALSLFSSSSPALVLGFNVSQLNALPAPTTSVNAQVVVSDVAKLNASTGDVVRVISGQNTSGGYGVNVVSGQSVKACVSYNSVTLWSVSRGWCVS